MFRVSGLSTAQNFDLQFKGDRLQIIVASEHNLIS